MKEFLLLTLAVARVPAFSPAKTSSVTLAQRVSALAAKLACLVLPPAREGGSQHNCDGKGIDSLEACFGGWP